MKFAVAVHGTRGDVEPCTAVALELLHRGHEVRMAVPPNLVGFVESAGPFNVVAYGPDSGPRALSWSTRSVAQWRASQLAESGRTAEARSVMKWWRVHNPVRALGNLRAYLTDGWADMSAVLDELAEGADLILTGMTYQEVAANVAEHRHIPLAALHFCPVRPSSQTLPVRLPAPLLKPFFAMTEWGYWRLFKPAEDAQRSALGLPASRARSQRRIEASGALEIQAYDKVFYPQLAKEWGASRPLVGSVTMQRSTDADQDVLAWVAAGSPPIYFGLGSMPIEDPAATVAMIAGVCAQLGERALICLAAGDLDTAGYGDHVMIVPSVNHALVFPRCRAIVHHGGSGTTAASTRSGVPTVILWVGADQPAWAARVESLGIGTGRRFSATDHDSLLEMLRSVLTPGCAERARSVAAQMTTPEAAVTAAATLIEAAARAGSPSRAAY